MAVMSACLPTMRPLLQRTIPKLLSIGSSSFGSKRMGRGLSSAECTYPLRSKESAVPQRVPGPFQGHITISKPAKARYFDISRSETA